MIYKLEDGCYVDFEQVQSVMMLDDSIMILFNNHNDCLYMPTRLKDKIAECLNDYYGVIL